MVDFRKMLRCVLEVSKAVLDENKRIVVDITFLETHVDDGEMNTRVQDSEVEHIRRCLQDMEKVQASGHDEIHRAISDMVCRHREQSMSLNERGENRFNQLKDILNELQA